tara:strand:+ start:400 stop:603 length:204 start_codon:yes stop_codon:yes gene_type:complete
MNYDEQIRDEVEREIELYASMIDMLQNGDVSIDFENKFSKNRIRDLNAYLVNHYYTAYISNDVLGVE